MKEPRLMSPVNYLSESLLWGAAAAELQLGTSMGHEVGCKCRWFVSFNDSTHTCGIEGSQSDQFWSSDTHKLDAFAALTCTYNLKIIYTCLCFQAGRIPNRCVLFFFRSHEDLFFWSLMLFLLNLVTQPSPSLTGKLPLQSNSPLGDNLCINNIPWWLCVVYTYKITGISVA